MTEAEKHILKQIGRMSGKFNTYTLFNDWITMLAGSRLQMLAPQSMERSTTSVRSGTRAS